MKLDILYIYASSVCYLARIAGHKDNQVFETR